MVSIKDLAYENHVTYEAVRQQVKRYEKELEDHIFVQGRTKYLDDYAVEFLNSKRESNPVVVLDLNRDEEIERLRKANDALKDKIILLQEKIAEYTEDRILLLTAKNELLSAQAELSEARDQIEVLSSELEEYKSRESTRKIETEKKTQQGWWYKLFHLEEYY